jgi:uncharacterized protein YvpB
MKNFISIICLFVISFGCSKEEKNTSIDITTIAGRDLASVEKILGEGRLIDKINSNNTPCGDCPKYSFKNGDIEIVFIESKADWIKIKNMGDASFSNCSIDYLGKFDCINRTFKSDVVMRWKNIKGFEEISLIHKYENSKPTFKVDYAYIKVNTK